MQERVGHKPSFVSAKRRMAAIYLDRPLRAGSSGLPGTIGGADHTAQPRGLLVPYLTLLPVGFAMPSVSRQMR